jgi:hypothetical protein
MGKGFSGRTVGQLSKQIDHKRRLLVRKGLACWYMPYNTLEHELKKLED